MASISVPNAVAARTTSDSEDLDENYAALVTFLNSNTLHKDGSVAMEGFLTTVGTPSSANHICNKSYMDTVFASAGVSSPLPVGSLAWFPGAAPTGYIAANGAWLTRAHYMGLWNIFGYTFGAYPGSPVPPYYYPAQFRLPTHADLATGLPTYIRYA